MGPQRLALTYDTLTPIWSGGANRKMDRLHETGVMGSLRWWYEVLVRGVGGHACEPSSAACQYDPKKAHDGICDVCRVFGATGWRRRFRLSIDDEHLKPDPKSEIPGWPLPSLAQSGQFTIRLVRLDPHFDLSLVAALLQFVADWGALGAKDQIGFGVIAPTGDHRVDPTPLCEALPKNGTDSRGPAQRPALDNMFFAAVQPLPETVTEYGTPRLKRELRSLLRLEPDTPASQTRRHFVFGFLEMNPGGRRMASKVGVSLPYGEANTMRVVGWLPHGAREYGEQNRDDIRDLIFEHLNTNYRLEYWRESNPPTGKNEGGLAFARSLLGCRP